MDKANAALTTYKCGGGVGRRACIKLVKAQIIVVKCGEYII